MGRIYMRVEIRNESNTTLRWRHDELEHGGWTPRWYPSKGVAVAPGRGTQWQAEGSLVKVTGSLQAPTTGCEARVWYRVDGSDEELYVHVDSPLVESQYGNTFHIWAPKGYEAILKGGQKDKNNRATLSVRFRESAYRSVPRFLPSNNGLHFSNSDWSSQLPAVTLGWVWNRLREVLGTKLANTLGIAKADEDWLPITSASQGMCGGMVFAVMDYFNAGLLPPDDTKPPTSQTDELYQYIRARLLDSFDVKGSGYRWLAYSSPSYPNGDEGVAQMVGLARGRAWVTYREEWPKIRDDIDNGRLSPIGLVRTDTLDIGVNHQILGYGYKQDGQKVDLWIYDPVQPDQDNLRLCFDITDTAHEVHVSYFRGEEDITTRLPRIFAILHMEGYRPQAAPRGQNAKQEAAAEIIDEFPSYAVVSGTVTETRRTKCGDFELGHWVVETTRQFPVMARHFRSNAPLTFNWTVADQPVSAGHGTIRPVIEGRRHTITYVNDPATGTLTLTSNSGPGESYETNVAVTVSDGNASKHAISSFASVGAFDGFKPGDLEKWGKWLKRSIPGLADWKDFLPQGPDPVFDPDAMRSGMLEHVREITKANTKARKELESFVQHQVVQIEIDKVQLRRGAHA